MTIYAKVEKGKVVSVGLPETGVLEDGRTVSGYHLLSDKILRKEGWLPVEDERPEYDESTEYLVGPEYKFRGKKVIAEYTVEKIQPPEPVADAVVGRRAVRVEPLFGPPGGPDADDRCVSAGEAHALGQRHGLELIASENVVGGGPFGGRPCGLVAPLVSSSARTRCRGCGRGRSSGPSLLRAAPGSTAG